MERSSLQISLSLALLLLYAQVEASSCDYCRYVVMNCSSNTGSNEKKYQKPTSVCDKSGKIQVDDVFCDEKDCNCGEKRVCASITMGCNNLFKSKNRKRCISNESFQNRFAKCAIAQNLTKSNMMNLESDWVFFKEPSKCKSTDCLVLRELIQCNVVQCGDVVIGWKENQDYHVIVDGSLKKDLTAGVFHLTFSTTETSICPTIETKAIEPCYVLQTRNSQNGTCDGIYLQFDKSIKSTQDYKLSTLSWPVWFATVGSVFMATLAILAVVIAYFKFKRVEDQEAQVELLNQSTNDHHSVEDDEDVADSRQQEKDTDVVRKRAVSPPLRDDIL